MSNDTPTPVNEVPVPSASVEAPVVPAVPLVESVVEVDEPEEQSTDGSIEPETEIAEDEPEETSTRKPHQALQEAEINNPIKLTTGDKLILPSHYDRETRDVLESMPNVNMLDTAESREWANAISEGMGYSTSSETFVSTLEDKDAAFRQRVVHNDISLMAQAPKFKAKENENLKGERAVIRMISHLGLGTLYQAPMWHSGFWITFKPPTESELIELNRIMIADKIMFGRYSYGLAYSNITAYTVDRLVDFALSHVYDTTAKAEDISIENLRHHISCQDIHSLLWGFLCTMYPRGFMYERACVNDPEKCNFILKETLNVTKLQWTNNNSLTDWQKTHMSSRQSKTKDLASITRYKEELSKTQKKQVTINKDGLNAITMTIKTPSISEYVDAGHRWIGDIVATVEAVLGTNASDAERNGVITRHGQATAMRQYSHWIDSIEFDTSIIDDKETIELNLAALSSDDIVREDFIKAVVEYINKSTISVIGIPVFDCPQCSHTQESPLNLPQYQNIIPLDVIQVFFGLLTQRLDRITDR